MLIFRDTSRTMYRHSQARSHVSRLAILALLIAGFLVYAPSFVAAQTDDEAADPVAVFNGAQDLHEKGDYIGAIELYKKALKIEPHFPEAEYQCGIAYLALGKNAEAEQAFRRTIEIRPDWTLALTSLGSLLVWNWGFEKEAERILLKVLELEPQNSPALVAMTDLRLKTRADFTVLADLLARVTTLTSRANPTAAIWAARGSLENALGKHAAAIASLTNSLKINPKQAFVSLQLADVALADGDIVMARDIARTLETRSPTADLVKLLQAKIFFAEGNADEALKILDAIPAATNGAFDLRTKILATSSANPADVEKQLETNPHNAVVLGRLCSLYRIPDPVKALGYCREASLSEPSNVNHAIGFGAALVRAKQFDAAINVLRKIIETAPDNATAHANLATALFEMKRYREAKAEYLWLTTKQPNLVAAYFFLAITHDRLDEYADAAANYQQYLRIADPAANKLDIEKVNLRLPALLKKIKK